MTKEQTSSRNEEGRKLTERKQDIKEGHSSRTGGKRASTVKRNKGLYKLCYQTRITLQRLLNSRMLAC